LGTECGFSNMTDCLSNNFASIVLLPLADKFALEEMLTLRNL